jgi:hypothetical protein
MLPIGSLFGGHNTRSCFDSHVCMSRKDVLACHSTPLSDHVRRICTHCRCREFQFSFTFSFSDSVSQKFPRNDVTDCVRLAYRLVLAADWYSFSAFVRIFSVWVACALSDFFALFYTQIKHLLLGGWYYWCVVHILHLRTRLKTYDILLMISFIDSFWLTSDIRPLR